MRFRRAGNRRAAVKKASDNEIKQLLDALPTARRKAVLDAANVTPRLVLTEGALTARLSKKPSTPPEATSSRRRDAARSERATGGSASPT